MRRVSANNYVSLSFYDLLMLLHGDYRMLKHSLHDMADTDVCFFVKDPEDDVRNYLERNDEVLIKEVMGTHRLRKEYGTHEGRRELARQFDVFLVDNRVSPMMPNLLGNTFLKAKKMPLQVDIRDGNLKGIKKALCSTSFSLRQGTSSTLRIGKVDLSADENVENLHMAVDGVVKRLPGGWDDVQSLVLKTNKSPALPIFSALPTVSKSLLKGETEISVPKEVSTQAKHRGKPDPKDRNRREGNKKSEGEAEVDNEKKSAPNAIEGVTEETLMTPVSTKKTKTPASSKKAKTPASSKKMTTPLPSKRTTSTRSSEKTTTPTEKITPTRSSKKTTTTRSSKKKTTPLSVKKTESVTKTPNRRASQRIKKQVRG